jgi:hypothetical protein
MRKLILSIFIFTTIFVSCNTEEDSNLNNESASKFVNMVELKKTSDNLTDFAYNLGVNKINVTNDGNILIYNINSSKEFIFRGEKINIGDYSIKLFENKISLNDNYYLTLNSNKEIFMNTPNYQGALNSMPIDFQKDINVFVLKFYLNEISTKANEKITFSERQNLEASLRGSCSFWNTYYAIGIGLTKSAAIADMNYEIADSMASGELLGCVQLGGAEAVAFSGGTMWATAFCCR